MDGLELLQRFEAIANSSRPRVAFVEQGQAIDAACERLNPLVDVVRTTWNDALGAIEERTINAIVAGKYTDSRVVARTILTYGNRRLLAPGVSRMSGASLFLARSSSFLLVDSAVQEYPTDLERTESGALASSLASRIGINGPVVRVGYRTDGLTWQLDAALNLDIALAKGHPLRAPAAVLVMQDIGVANTAYKAIQLGAALACPSALDAVRHVGPLYLGLSRSISDLSRGASIQEIVDTALVAGVLGSQYSLSDVFSNTP